MEKEYVIGLNKGVDTVQFWKDVETITNLDNIPNRAIEVANPRSGSNRLTHYYLTDEEAEIIRQDDRVFVVEIPADQRDDISIGLNAIQTANFTRANDFDGDNYADATGSAKNWGLLRSRFLISPYTSSSTPTRWDLSGSYYYTLDGEGVDVVIQDSGIQADHPEWEDSNGNSRLQEIDWYSASFMTGSQSSSFYTDYDGHGTHVAGITAGKTFGFAKGARIYAQKLAGLEGSSDPSGGIPIADAFDTIRLWHANKSGSRPTVVNMSWGYSSNVPSGATYFNNATEFVWRGTTYTGLGFNEKYTFGISSFNSLSNFDIPVRISSVDIEIEEMIDAGIHVVIAAGNLDYKIELSGGTDYNSRFTQYYNGNPAQPLGTYFYHRGSSPISENAIMVGALDYEYYDSGSAPNTSSIVLDRAASYSNAGPGVDIYAPGSFVVSACSNTNNKTDANYYENSSYKQAILNGTSMAAPQVAGFAALMLQINPKSSPEQLKTKLLSESGNNMLVSSGSGNIYYGSPYGQNTTKEGDNKVLYNYLGQIPSPGKVMGNLDIFATLTTS